MAVESIPRCRSWVARHLLLLYIAAAVTLSVALQLTQYVEGR